MNFPVSLAALIFVAYSSLSFGGQCDAPNEITDPEQFEWTYVNDSNDPHYVGTMEIAEADLVIGSETVHTRVYRQAGGCDSIPGPTLNMVPGQKYVLKFRNRLPYEPKAEAHNVFKDPNVSNLHTHGVHISGETPGDDVTRSFEGGAGGDFVYDIPPDHMGGTFWYHAHHHGSTYLQVSGGAFGLIVIDDQFDNIPASGGGISSSTTGSTVTTSRVAVGLALGAGDSVAVGDGRGVDVDDGTGVRVAVAVSVGVAVGGGESLPQAASRPASAQAINTDPNLLLFRLRSLTGQSPLGASSVSSQTATSIL